MGDGEGRPAVAVASVLVESMSFGIVESMVLVDVEISLVGLMLYNAR